MIGYFQMSGHCPVILLMLKVQSYKCLDIAHWCTIHLSLDFNLDFAYLSLIFDCKSTLGKGLLSLQDINKSDSREIRFLNRRFSNFEFFFSMFLFCDNVIKGSFNEIFLMD